MERSHAHTSKPKPESVEAAALAATCRRCHVAKGDCKCPGPPRGRREKVAVDHTSTSNSLLKGRSLLKHTKSKVSKVPDSTVRLRPSSETKSKDCSSKETKLLLNDASIGKECLKYDKEAVNVGSCSIGSESKIIFENDFDCVDSRMLVRDESSQTMEDKQTRLERTPVKLQRKLELPGAPLKAPATKEPPRTPGDHCEYAVRTPRHACPFCAKTFRSNGKLNSHVFSHTGERPFACKHCHKAFSSKFKLVRHLLIHSEDRKFLCTVCERRFLRNDHLKNHYKVHDPRKVVFPCERTGCEKEYSSALSQRKHEAWHRAQDGDLTCLLCGLKHEATPDLLLHLRRHSGSRLLKSPADRKFRCHVCERNFLTRKDVTRHLVVHTGERDFLCQFCPQRFGRKDHLVRHIKKSHHAPAKRKINKSILTLNKSRSTKMRKLATPISKTGTTEEKSEGVEDEEIEPSLESDESVDDEDLEGELVIPDLVTDFEVPPSSIQEVKATIEPEPVSALLPEPPPSEPPLDLFDFPDHVQESFDVDVIPVQDDSLLSEANTRLLETQGRKGEDLFEGTSQSLMFGEPSFDEDEYKTSDLMLNQGESSGELLRYLLLSDADAPLPGFSQIFNSGPPSSS